MPHAIFDSRSSRCKTPYGAVPCGARIFLTLRPPLAEGLLACTLLLHNEFAGTCRTVPLPLRRQEGERAVFAGSYAAPERPELVWYFFRFHRENGRAVYLGRNGLVSRAEEAEPWQQTVYEDALSTPSWFGRGVSYQIFPDRFRRGPYVPPEPLPGRRVLHPRWDEGMAFLGERDGESQNHDYFGGNLAGIEEKLPYLKSLGVSTLYLCPIFEADSNHRYNTGDYEKIDPLLGTEADFRRLCAKARTLGIHIMLDGVFNHTGSNSRYFNAEGSYPGPGAAQSRESPYYPWYTFRKWPDQYESWWGIQTLPAVREENPDYIDYIIEGSRSIIRRWLQAGADGWRLDVADELPDSFIARIRQVMGEEKPDAFLLGEVWEDGSNKISYDQRRRYLLGRETHGLMNYPFRTAVLAYLRGGDGEDFREAMEALRENYPPDAFFSAMNLLGTHDTPRILTLLGADPDTLPADRPERAAYRLSEEARARALSLLRAGAILLFTFPGSPTVCYGDEAGAEGLEDPFNRIPYPWGREDAGLRRHYARLGSLRASRPSLQSGDLQWLLARGSLLAFAREGGGERTVTLLNAGDAPAEAVLPWAGPLAADALTGRQFLAEEGFLSVRILPREGMILI